MSIWPGDKPPDQIDMMDENELRDELRKTLSRLSSCEKERDELGRILHRVRDRLDAAARKLDSSGISVGLVAELQEVINPRLVEIGSTK